MPTAHDYKKAKALPATPAGPGRPVAGAICHICNHVCTGDHTHGPLHPADYNWAEPRLRVPRLRLRKNRDLENSESQHPPSPIRITEQVIPDQHQNGRCPCRPWRLVTRVNGRKQKTWFHNPKTCPHHAKPFTPGLSGERPKLYQAPPPERHPKLPRPLSLYLYHKLLKAGARLVLCYYEADTGRKRPKYKNWHRLRPDFAEVCRHLAEHPNNLIGIVPASVGAVVLDVDYGDWKVLAEHLGSAATTNRTLRPKGRHIWIPADPKGKKPTNSGFNFQDLASGDVRYQNGYVVVWNATCVRNALKMCRIRDAGKSEQGYYPTVKMRRYKNVPVSFTVEASGTTADWHYTALYDAQTAAAVRRRMRNARALECRRLRRRGWTIMNLAIYFRCSARTIRRYISKDLDMTQILTPWELRRRALSELQRKAMRLAARQAALACLLTGQLAAPRSAPPGTLPAPLNRVPPHADVTALRLRRAGAAVSGNRTPGAARIRAP